VNDVPRALLSQPLIESGKEIAAHFGVSLHHSYQVMS